MIIIYHKSERVTNLENLEASDGFVGLPLLDCVLKLAKDFPEEILAWCREDYKTQFNSREIPDFFTHHQLLFSYHIGEDSFLNNSIGYVEDSNFIKVNKSVRYSTWQMSSDVGAAHASVLNRIPNPDRSDSFSYLLNSFAKKAAPQGLFCYSEPALLTGTVSPAHKSEQTNSDTVFKFVRQHYRSTWIFILLFNLLIYEKRFPIGAFFKSLFLKKRKLDAHFSPHLLNEPYFQDLPTVDVIIPTIGRKIYLYDFLKDLAKQTILPANVIIIEQNANPEAVSELDYLVNEQWPFKIKHTLSHQPGACRARNLALEQRSSEYIFLADDDIRIDANCIEEIIKKMTALQAHAVTVNCRQAKDEQMYVNIFQSSFFGSGCSMVKSAAIGDSRFSMAYEFGFGEDNDFGMQLRNKGYDIIYLPNPTILHIKAPVGGFRIKMVFPWNSDSVAPKPSPTVMLFYLKYYTKQQLAGYKTILFFKYYSLQSTKNPIRYYRNFTKRWDKSIVWANHLKNVK